MFVICTHLQNAACFPPEIAKSGTEKHECAIKLPNGGFEQNVLWKKRRCVCFDPLLLLGLHVTSKSGSACHWSSKVTLARPPFPLDLSFLMHTVRGGGEMNSGW